jgi:hypothetical protein
MNCYVKGMHAYVFDFRLLIRVYVLICKYNVRITLFSASLINKGFEIHILDNPHLQK